MRDAQAQAAELVYQRQKTAHAEAARRLQQERLEKQGLPRSRDWDLSRPDHLRIDCPARYGMLNYAVPLPTNLSPVMP